MGTSVFNKYNTSFQILIKADEKYLQNVYVEYQNLGDLYIFSVLLDTSLCRDSLRHCQRHCRKLYQFSFISEPLGIVSKISCILGLSSIITVYL